MQATTVTVPSSALSHEQLSQIQSLQGQVSNARLRVYLNMAQVAASGTFERHSSMNCETVRAIAPFEKVNGSKRIENAVSVGFALAGGGLRVNIVVWSES